MDRRAKITLTSEMATYNGVTAPSLRVLTSYGVSSNQRPTDAHEFANMPDSGIFPPDSIAVQQIAPGVQQQQQAQPQQQQVQQQQQYQAPINGGQSPNGPNDFYPDDPGHHSNPYPGRNQNG